MDWVNVMTYDFTGDWTDYAGHHSPLFASSKQPGGSRRSTEATMKYLLEERGMPADRLAVGIPLYGRGFAVAEPYASTKGVPKARIPQGDYRNLHKLQQSRAGPARWDDETKNPWLVSPDRSAVIGYDDAESVALKTEWAMKQGLPRGLLLAGRRRPPARRHEPPPGSLPQGVGQGGSGKSSRASAVGSTVVVCGSGSGGGAVLFKSASA